MDPCFQPLLMDPSSIRSLGWDFLGGRGWTLLVCLPMMDPLMDPGFQPLLMDPLLAALDGTIFLPQILGGWGWNGVNGPFAEDRMMYPYISLTAIGGPMDPP